ncbi:hypothetical protein U9M48_000220 [Paspalum notatum var. saurae]|uniref:Uncharacterized protein n=1 Tax=Paspalum notatum var. saurae TaxID=547442 RepID=A0AAQ3SHX2_PASNO
MCSFIFVVFFPAAATATSMALRMDLLEKVKDTFLKQQELRYTWYALRYSTAEVRLDTRDLYSWVPVPASRASRPSAKQCARRWFGSPRGDDCALICRSSLAALRRSLLPTACAQWISNVCRSSPAVELAAIFFFFFIVGGGVVVSASPPPDHLVHRLAISFLIVHGHHQLGVPATTCCHGLIRTPPVLIAILLLHLLPGGVGFAADEEAVGGCGGQDLLSLLHALEERLGEHVIVSGTTEHQQGALLQVVNVVVGWRQGRCGLLVLHFHAAVVDIVGGGVGGVGEDLGEGLLGLEESGVVGGVEEGFVVGVLHEHPRDEGQHVVVAGRRCRVVAAVTAWRRREVEEDGRRERLGVLRRVRHGTGTGSSSARRQLLMLCEFNCGRGTDVQNTVDWSTGWGSRRPKTCPTTSSRQWGLVFVSRGQESALSDTYRERRHGSSRNSDVTTESELQKKDYLFTKEQQCSLCYNSEMASSSIVCDPRGHGIEYAALPPLHEPLAINVDEEVPVVLLPHPVSEHLNDIGTQRQLPQPRAAAPRLPLPVRLRPLHPVGALAGDDVERAASDEVALNHQAPLVAPRRRGVQDVEHGRVVEERVPESRNEEGRAVRGVGDGEDEHVRPHLSDVVQHGVPWWAGAPAAAHVVDAFVVVVVHQVLELRDAVDDEHLVGADVQVGGADRLPPRGDASPERERQAALAGEGCQPAPRLLDPRGRAEPRLGDADAGHPHLRRRPPLGQIAEQVGPLAPVVHAVVDDVQLVRLPGGDGLPDGHVGETESRHLEAGGGKVEVVGSEEVDHGGALHHERPVQRAAGSGEPRLQPLREAVGQPLVRVADRRGVPLDLPEQLRRAAVVAPGHRVRAVDERRAQIHHHRCFL